MYRIIRKDITMNSNLIMNNNKKFRANLNIVTVKIKFQMHFMIGALGI